MYVLKATFDPDLAIKKVGELLALGDEPERLAEKLGVGSHVDRIRDGIAKGDFKRLFDHIERLRKFIEFEKQMETIRSGKWAFNFMGKGFAEKRLEGLALKRRKLGSLIEAPRWFYKQERVRLISMLRDFAVELSEQGDAEWMEVEVSDLDYPIVNMFESGDTAKAKALIAELDKPFADLDPKFVLTGMEGHRTLNFDFAKSLVTFYMPPRLAEEV